MDVNKINERIVGEYLKRIKKSGFKLTKTRITILNTFLENPHEISADELFFLSHKKYPKIGQATVYRNLKILEKEGLIEKKGYRNNKAIYSIKSGKDKKSGRDFKNIRNDKNKPKINTVREKINPEILSLKENGNYLADYINMNKIDMLQSQLNKWIGDLKKIKREKEWALEDAIKDFGKADRIIGLYNNRRSGLIQILLDIQNEYRWLPEHILLYISNRLDIPLSNIYDVATFYKYFNLEPQGRHSIVVCMGTACHVRGAMKLLQRIVSMLGIKPGDTTGDYNFTLSTVNCLGCCALGPVMMIDNKYYSNPSVVKIRKILKQFQ